MLQTLRLGTNVVQTVGQATGIPGAAAAGVIASEIVRTCEEVSKYKRRARSIGEKTRMLMNALAEKSPGLEGTELQQHMDEVVVVLERTLKRTRRWSSLGLLKRWLQKSEIEEGIEKCERDLDTALQIFHLQNQILLHRAQIDGQAIERQNQAENRELLLQVLSNQTLLRSVIAMGGQGKLIADQLMAEGQQSLREMRQGDGGTQNLIIAEARSSSPTSISPPTGNNNQQYRDVERALMKLHRMGVPPALKLLNGEVTKIGEVPVAGGTNSDIYHGRWLNDELVALKGLRSVRAGDAKAQKFFEREILMWSKLNNKHILTLHGIVTDFGNLHTVSPWLANGNVLNYVKKSPEADRMRLIRGAAEGLSYLHANGIVHGNIKCTNILVSDSGDACITDFGMAQVIEEVTATAISTTLLEVSVRWIAPEIIEGGSDGSEGNEGNGKQKLRKESDVYSFAMSILELLTEHHPFQEYKRSVAIIRAVMKRQHPARPTGEEVQRWLSEDLWALMEECWAFDPANRPTMEVVTERLMSIRPPIRPSS